MEFVNDRTPRHELPALENRKRAWGVLCSFPFHSGLSVNRVQNQKGSIMTNKQRAKLARRNAGNERAADAVRLEKEREGRELVRVARMIARGGDVLSKRDAHAGKATLKWNRAGQYKAGGHAGLLGHISATWIRKDTPRTLPI
jgi:hypothetical protein